MNKHFESLYQNLLSGKLPHNLSWSEAVELINHLGEVQPHGDHEFMFRVGGQRAFFKKPHTHNLGVEEVSRLRKFLKEAGPDSSKSADQYGNASALAKRKANRPIVQRLWQRPANQEVSIQ